MPRFRLKPYLGIVFIAVVIVPAIVLSLVSLRAISHEEAYIEKQIEGTLSAEVVHVAAVVTTELDQIRSELASTIVIPQSPDAGVPFAEWKQRSALVEIPFLLSPTHEILWPAAGPEPGETLPPTEEETSFLGKQQAFLEDEEETPVYENIAVAYKNEILGETPEADKGGLRQADSAGVVPARKAFDQYLAGSVQGEPLADKEVTEAEEVPGSATAPDRYAAAAGEAPKTEAAPHRDLKETRSRVLAKPGAEDRGQSRAPHVAPPSVEAQDKNARSTPPELEQPRSQDLSGEKTRSQAAISQFQQSEPVRRKVYEKAEQAGQEVSYRNVEITDEAKAAESRGEAEGLPSDEDAGAGEVPKKKPAEETAKKPIPKEPGEAPVPTKKQPEPESLGRLRSIFISQPLSFSEIVAKGQSGIIPRIIDGRLQLLYWQKALNGNIVGCLIDSKELKERIVGALPGIYSPVRILTVLDERGRPLIVPPGHDRLDWRRPLAAQEISEILPRWEVAAYLTDPEAISSRAQVATSLMWVIILILFVSILVGGTLVVRSTYAEMKLAQQKTSFVANVSHELKTPLTSIRLFAEMLRDGRQPDAEKRREYLDIMAAEVERLTRLVNNVLDFARMERGEKRYNMRPCDLVEVSAGVVESQRARLENNGFEVVFTTHMGRLITQADEEGLKQALVNLLSNAEKYSADTKQIEIAVRREDGRAVIAVSDRGIGIPPGEAERIFDEFYRVDDTLTSKVKGAGLGLTIARRIIRDHGGDIRYLRRQGGGSTFEILIPLAEDQK